jgi:hypothetical protein
MSEVILSPIDPIPNTTSRALYDPTAIGIATFLGTPLAGSALMALNYKNLEKPKLAVWTVVIGIVATALLLVIAFILPDNFPGTGLSLGALLATVVVAKKSQGSLIEAHQQAGGKMGSRWVGAGVGLACLAIVVGLIFLWVLTNPDFPGTRLAVGEKDEIYYSGTATEDDAHGLADSLKKIGFLQDRGAIVQLRKDETGTALSFTVKDDAWNNPKFVAAFESIARNAAASIGGLPIEIRLLDEQNDVKKTWTVR